VRGHVGWFPEAYVEKMDQAGWSDAGGTTTGSSIDSPMAGTKRHPLEGIQELPENVSDTGSIADAGASVSLALEASHSAFMPVATKVSEESSSPILGQVHGNPFFLFCKLILIPFDNYFREKLSTI
jgi:hypothetical protein